MSPKARFSWLGLLVLAVGAFVSGPRIEINTQLRPLLLPEDLDAYLAHAEAHFADLTPGTEKKIFWQSPKQVTPFAVAYFPGFSATRQELSPLPEQIAADLGANLFATRFAGHGRGGEAMLEGSVNAWLNDGYEALAISRRLGQKLVLIAVSTGASIAAWLAAQPEFRSQLAALVLISPNFGVKDPKSLILTWPWGGQIAELLIGKERSWKPQNALHARYWTWRYPTKAILPMMGVVQLARSVDFSQFRIPTMIVYSPDDQVINTQAVEQIFGRLAAEPKQLLAFRDSQDPDQHMLAGDIISPRSTPVLRQKIRDFLRQIPQPETRQP